MEGRQESKRKVLTCPASDIFHRVDIRRGWVSGVRPSQWVGFTYYGDTP